MKKYLDIVKGKKILTVLPNGYHVCITKNALLGVLQRMQYKNENFDSIIVTETPGVVTLIFR